MDASSLQLTNRALAEFTLLVASLDTLLILAIGKFFPRERFGRLAGCLGLVSFLFYAVLWTSVLTWGWDWFYRYIFPSWMHFVGLAWGIPYGLTGLGMAWLSLKMGGRPAVNFCLLGGVEGLLTHLWAIYGQGAVSKPPVMQGVNQELVLVFAVFEKAFYWIMILLMAAGIQTAVASLQRRNRPAAPSSPEPLHRGS